MSPPSRPALVSLDPGLTVIEASAGTGKTYQITDLVTRLVAERGIPMREIVVVTFTRAATAELKDRIRGRLTESLEAIEASGSPNPDLEAFVHRCLSIPEAADRLREAQRDFDQALISTIHGFCQRTIDSQGFECGADSGLQLLSDTGELLEEIVDDWLSERLRVNKLEDYQALVQEAGFTREGLLKLARAATQAPDTPVHPAPEDWTEDRFSAQLSALSTRWAGPEGSACGQIFADQRAASEEVIRSLLAAAGETAGAPLHRGNWLAETFIDRLGWWPALGDPLKNGLYSTSKKNMALWAQGTPGTSVDGQAVALAIQCLSKDTDKDIRAVEQWLDNTSSPHQPTEEAAINRLLEACPADQSDGRELLLEQTASLMDFRKCIATVDRVRFVQWTREQLSLRCERRRLRTYHDQLRLLAAPLSTPNSDSARALIASVGGRVRATLIDEFQDTDALQWRIFQTLLGPWCGAGPDPRSHSEHRLFLIGDPKQAIYSFRGANLHVYLDAVSAVHRGLGQVHTLDTNYRSDAGLITGLSHLMEGKRDFFGDARVEPPAIQAAQPDRLSPKSSPLQVRFLVRDPAGGAKPLSGEEATEQATRQVAQDVVALLEEGLVLSHLKRDLDPGDIAVLVRSHAEGRLIQQALKASDVPSVNFSTQDVFKSDTSRHLLSWLRAVQEPGRAALIRTAATTPLFGMDGVLLAALDQDQPQAVSAWEQWIEQLRDWRDAFPKRRFLTTLRDAMETRLVAERLLSRTDGERRISDLQQLGELCHAAETEGRLGLQALINWLEQQQRDKAEDPDATDIRLESESGAVKIQTMHTSKGLQYPVVFVPFAWRSAKLSRASKNNLLISDTKEPTQRLLDLQLSHIQPKKAARIERAAREQLEESLRLAYVAMTRAEHRCILTAGHIKPISGGPLASMLWGDEAPEGEDRLAAGTRRVEGWTRKEASAQDQEDMYQALSSWAQASPTLAGASGIHSVSAQRCPPVLVRARWQPGPQERPALQTRHWEREGLDRTWRRHSYSSFVKSAGHAPLTVQEEAGLDLDQDVQEPTSSEPASPGPSVPLAAFPAGASPGIVLHEVLEKMDFVWAKTPEGAAAFDLLLGQILGSHGLLAHQEVLHQGLVQALLTPLGGPVGSLRLADLSRKDRLDELRFDMPLAGGDGHRASQGDIKNGGIEGGDVVRGGDLIRALQAAPSQGVPLDYLKALTRRRWTDLSGFLNGAIDLIMRAPTEDGRVRWFVLDYKSNRLAPGSQKDVPVGTYRAPRLLEEMAHHDYHLQYHLYTLALHRFLKTRLPDYSYDRDVGGAYYLFVRGMVGPTQGEPQTGVIFARPSRSVIEAMDTLIGGSP